jgi:hypothetical protein
MITVRGAAGATVLVALVALPSCKTTQPTQGAKPSIVLSFSARALLDTYNCWDVSGTNAPPSGVYCEQVFESGAAKLSSRVLPWPYDLEISVIPSGQTAEQVIASSIDGTGNVPPGFPTFGNLTDYDTIESTAPSAPAHPDSSLTYSNPRQVSQGNRTFGLFAGFRYPEPNVLGQSPAFTFEVNKGDTIIVRARKIRLENNPTFNALNQEQDASLTLSGQLTINGVEANSLGTTMSPITADGLTINGGGLTFSSTVR